MEKDNKKFLQKAVLLILGIIAAGGCIILVNSKVVDTHNNINGDGNRVQEIKGNSGNINYGFINGDYIINNSGTLNHASIEMYELAPVSSINYNDMPCYTIFKEQSQYSDADKVYCFDKDFMSMIAISNNNSNKEIILKKFKLVAENIVVDTMPHINLIYDFDPYYNTEYLFDTYVSNVGWGNASNLEIIIKDEDGFLNMLFGEDDLSVHLPLIEYGSGQEIKCANFDNLNKEAYEELLYKYGEFFIEVTMSAKCDEVDFGTIWRTVLRCSSGGIEDIGGLGYNAESAYAIIVDTGNDNFVLDVDISQNIPAGGILELPLCFFPDKSCVLSYYVEFEVYDGFENYSIHTEKRNIEFFVNSCYDNIEYKDVSNGVNDPLNSFITYPYAILKRLDKNGEYYIVNPRLGGKKQNGF